MVILFKYFGFLDHENFLNHFGFQSFDFLWRLFKQSDICVFPKCCNPFSVKTNVFHYPDLRRVWIYQRGNQNPYIEEEQTTQWPKEKVQKSKQRSTKHTHKSKDLVTRTPLKPFIHVVTYYTDTWHFPLYNWFCPVIMSMSFTFCAYNYVVYQ